MKLSLHHKLATFLCAAVCAVNASGAQIVILQQPQSMVVFEGTKARFAIDAEADGMALNYQWQRNGIDIAGATEGELITDYVRFFANGDKFRVVISSPGLETVTSESAMLTVLGWDLYPRMIHAGRRTPESPEIVVVFWSKMSITTTLSIANWSLDGGATVKQVAVGRSFSECILTAENLPPGGNANLTVRNVKDQFGNASMSQTIAVTSLAPDPVLNVSADGNLLKITWRVSNYLYDPFELEFSSDAARPELWYPARTSSIINDGDLRAFTVETGGKARFFQLRRRE